MDSTRCNYVFLRSPRHSGDAMIFGLKTCFKGLNESFAGLGIIDANPDDRLEILLEQRNSRPNLFSGVTKLNSWGELGNICASFDTEAFTCLEAQEIIIGRCASSWTENTSPRCWLQTREASEFPGLLIPESAESREHCRIRLLCGWSGNKAPWYGIFSCLAFVPIVTCLWWSPNDASG